jgi:hypothetical protein
MFIARQQTILLHRKSRFAIVLLLTATALLTGLALYSKCPVIGPSADPSTARARFPVVRPEDILQSSGPLPYSWMSIPSAPEWNAKAHAGSQPIHPFLTTWPNSVAICTLAKEEAAADILEWLQYHRYVVQLG